MVRIIRVSDLGCGLADVYDRQVDGAAWEREAEPEPSLFELYALAAAEPEPLPVYVEEEFDELADV